MPRPPSNGDKRSFEPHADVEVVEVGRIVQRLLRPWVIVLLVVSFWIWFLWPVFGPFGPAEKPYWYQHRFPLPSGGELTYECHGEAKDRSIPATSSLRWETPAGTGEAKEYTYPPCDVEFRVRDDGGAAWVIRYVDVGEAEAIPVIEIAVDFATGEAWYAMGYPSPGYNAFSSKTWREDEADRFPEWTGPGRGKLLKRLRLVECGRCPDP